MSSSCETQTESLGLFRGFWLVDYRERGGGGQLCTLDISVERFAE